LKNEFTLNNASSESIITSTFGWNKWEWCNWFIFNLDKSINTKNIASFYFKVFLKYLPLTESISVSILLDKLFVLNTCCVVKPPLLSVECKWDICWFITLWGVFCIFVDSIFVCVILKGEAPLDEDDDEK
jgi:hypothetical protein